MSSHHLSASGRRALSTTMNDDARTSAQVPSKPGDAVSLTLSSFAKIEITLGQGVRIERRRVARNLSSSDGDRVEYLDSNVLVIEGTDGQMVGLQAYGTPPDRQAWPHTSVDVRKHDERNIPWFIKDGEVVATAELRDATFDDEDVAIVPSTS